MNDKTDATSDQLPDRLSTDPKSPYYDADVLARDVGIRFKGIEKNHEAYANQGEVIASSAVKKLLKTEGRRLLDMRLS